MREKTDAHESEIEVTTMMIEAAMEWTPSPYEIDTEDREAYAKMIQAILIAMKSLQPR